MNENAAYLVDETDVTWAPEILDTPDRRWLRVAMWVGGLLVVGVAFAFIAGWSLGTFSFSALVSFVYVPAASILILLVGIMDFPFAAALFFAYLGVAQMVGATFYVAGDGFCGVTLEQVLAIPLVLVGLFSPSAHRNRSLPFLMGASLVMFAVCGLISTVFARYPSTAAWTFFGRFVTPLAVIGVCAKRLRTVADFRVVWYGFVLGMLAIGVFDFRRAVIGVESRMFETGYSQRSLGGTLSYAIACLAIAGPALWLSHAYAMRQRYMRSAFWLLVVAWMGVLMWLGGHRGPVVFLGLLCIWWICVVILPSVLKGRMVIFALVGTVVVAGLVIYSLRSTQVDSTLVMDRLGEMTQHGLAGESRWPLWQMAFSLWTQSPVWGMGLNNWIEFDPVFESCHGTIAGLFLDTGLLGVVTFLIIFVQSLLISRKREVDYLPHDDLRFFLGSKVSWIIFLLAMCVELPFTSGQNRNNIFTYEVFMFPLLAMIAYRQRPEEGQYLQASEDGVSG